ncbi:unnamed protein product [Closterium sp. NIES-53]
MPATKSEVVLEARRGREVCSRRPTVKSMAFRREGCSRRRLRTPRKASSVTHVTVGGIAPTYGYFKFMPDRIPVTAPLVGRHDLLTWKESINPQLEMTGLMCFADGTVETLPESNAELRAEFRVVQLLTFTVISRYCSPVVQIALKSCRHHLDVGQWAWQFVTLTYQLGGGGSGGGKPAKDADKAKSAKDGSRGGESRCWKCWLCGDPSTSPSNAPTEPTPTTMTARETERGDEDASCSLVGIVEPSVLLAPEAGEDFQAVAAAVQANPAVVLLDSGCSHHLMGTKAAFVDFKPSGDVKHVCSFNGVRRTSKTEARSTTVMGCSSSRRRGTFLVERRTPVGSSSPTFVPAQRSRRRPRRRRWPFGRSSRQQRRHRPGGTRGLLTSALTPSQHMVATSLDIQPSAGTDAPCVSYVGGKLARHTFPDKGSNTDDALAVVHIDLCGPFWVAAKDGSLYFLVLKDSKTRHV